MLSLVNYHSDRSNNRSSKVSAAATVGFPVINPIFHLVDQRSPLAEFNKAIAINNTQIIAIALPETSELFDRR
ncbi:hypothetical protein [Nostoc sp.]|uniref:hypothetical protein n=1 Tax=Nostoc sp. TaxID=1180 RepID=UPI002FFD14BB